MTVILAERQNADEFQQDDGMLCAKDIRADLITPAGAIILAVTIIMSLILVLSFIVPSIFGMQLAIVGLLTFSCWLYLLNAATERLRLDDDELEYRNFFVHGRKFRLADVQAYKLTDLGIRLNGDFYILEVTTIEKNKTIEIGLGPCWHRENLVGFCRLIDQKLEMIGKE